MIIHFGFSAKIADAETAFLYGDLEEEISMEYLPGMTNVSKDESIISNKCIDDLVQVARQYYEKVVEILNKFGLIGGNVNLCLHMC